MKLLELVEELRENILRDTSDAVRTDARNYLLDDKSLVRYINDAQNRFATRTLCLREETTPAICHLQLVAGSDTYTLDPRVVAIYGAASSSFHIARSTYSALTGSNRFALGGGTLMRGQAGRPRWFYTDRETGKIGFYPAPDAEFAEDVVVLRVARLPLRQLAVEDMNAVPEIPVEYHLDLLEWAAWRALRNHDNDLENLQKASAHKKAFEDTVGELSRTARRLLMQELQFTPQTNWSHP